MCITTPGAELQQRSHGMGERLRRCRHDDKGPHDDVAGEQADWSRVFDAKVPGGGNVTATIVVGSSGCRGARACALGDGVQT